MYITIAKSNPVIFDRVQTYKEKLRKNNKETIKQLRTWLHLYGTFGMLTIELMPGGENNE